MSKFNPVVFSQPPRAVFLSGTKPAPSYYVEDIENAKREGYHQGAEETSRMLERQMLQQRADVVHLQAETLEAIKREVVTMSEQLRQMIPELVTEALSRILASIQPSREMVMGIISDLLAEIAPSKELVEVHLNKKDLELVESYEPELRKKYPEIRFSEDPGLKPGDCMIHSCFGIVDGRIETKLKAVKEMLS